MRQIKPLSDERIGNSCVHCGGRVETYDHCPSKVFLDEPYPDNLPGVPACKSCNRGYSVDEEYVACVLGCVLAGSTVPAQLGRAKIARIMSEKPKLRSMIASCMEATSIGTVVHPDMKRVANVLLKLARGHALYELSEECREPPTQLAIQPLMHLGISERQWFESPPTPPGWPEVGSRAMFRLLSSNWSPWLEVQKGNYRYSAVAGGDVEVRIVLHEYLACYCLWS